MKEISFFSIKDTRFLNCLGIILMVLHHTFNEKWYIDSIDYHSIDMYFAYARNFMGFAVVPLFAFITGYAYALRDNGSYSYVFYKIKNFLLKYYVLCLFMLALAVLFCEYSPSVLDIAEIIYPISSDLACFAWYVPFYIEAMLTLPVIKKLADEFGTKKSLLILLATYLSLELILGGQRL